MPITELGSYVAKNEISIAILCVPDMAAQNTLDSMVIAGIRGVLNFSSMQLKAPESCHVSNVNLAVELENLIYFVNARERAG